MKAGEAAALDRSALKVNRIDPWRFLGRYGAIMVLIGMLIGFSIAEPDVFPSKENLLNILSQSALTAIIAIGLTFPLVTGEFDLSIGYGASLGGVVACEMMLQGVGIPMAFVIAIAVGALIGLVNGLLVTKVGVNALIATLGVGTVIVGINYAITNGSPVVLDDPASFINITLGKLWGIPYPIFIMFGVAVLMWVLLNRTVVGQNMQAVGGNSEAARLAGVRTDRVKIYAFLISGMCAALTGVLLASQTGSAAVNGGDSYLLSAFAAAFFGSAVLREGQFHIVGTVVGVVTVAVGFNAIAILGLNTYTQYLFQGVLLIFAVGVSTIARKRVTS